MPRPLPLALALSLLVTAGPRRQHWVLWMVPLFLGLAHLPLWIEYRFSVPAQPFVWGLAMIGLGLLVRLCLPRQARARGAPPGGAS